MIGLSKSTIYDRIAKGAFPRQTAIGAGSLRTDNAAAAWLPDPGVEVVEE
jgi:predicted DNA-binding transcriptional regulator AlpA